MPYPSYADATREACTQYIRGFFDRLCYVDVPGKAIILTTNQLDLGRTVGARIRLLGIKCSIQKMDKVIKLRISGRAFLKKWSEEIGLEPEKQKKLDEVLSSYRRRNVEPTRTAEGTAEAEAQGVPGEQGNQG